MENLSTSNNVSLEIKFNLHGKIFLRIGECETYRSRVAGFIIIECVGFITYTLPRNGDVMFGFHKKKKPRKILRRSLFSI